MACFSQVVEEEAAAEGFFFAYMVMLRGMFLPNLIVSGRILVHFFFLVFFAFLLFGIDVVNNNKKNRFMM